MLKLFLADLKMTLRNKQAFFWALMFPIMFTVIFGFFFGKSTTVGTIGLINNSNTEIAAGLEKALSDSGLFNIDKSVKTIDESKDLIKKNKIAAALVIPENFGSMTPNASKDLIVVDDPANSQTNSILISFANNYLTNVNMQVSGIKASTFGVVEDKTNTKELSYFDFVMAGILGLALMNASIIGVSVGMSKYREDQILKRITTTPIKTWWFIFGEVASRLIVNILQVALILAIGVYGFDAHVYGNIFVIFALALLGGLLFQLIGFVIASVTKTTDAAQGMATAITIPMMFLGGVFFPIDTLPSWLYAFVQFLPIAPLLRIIRGVVLEGNSPFFNPINIIIVLAWIIICLGISIWKFRLSEE